MLWVSTFARTFAHVCALGIGLCCGCPRLRLLRESIKFGRREGIRRINSGELATLGLTKGFTQARQRFARIGLDGEGFSRLRPVGRAGVETGGLIDLLR